MKRLLLQTFGAVLVGVALGLAAHGVAEPEDRTFLLLIAITVSGAGGAYCLFAHVGRRRVVFKFEGGFMDGKTLTGDLKDRRKAKAPTKRCGTTSTPIAARSAADSGRPRTTWSTRCEPTAAM